METEMEMENKRRQANILITGTPGTGKTTTAELLGLATGKQVLTVGEYAKREKLFLEYDEEFDTHYMDEDRVLDGMEEELKEGNVIVEHHSCDLFPERWFDLVVVLRTGTEKLYDRLVERGYNEKKVQENMECEIMTVVLEDALECYDNSIVMELESNSVEDMESNVEKIVEWIANFENQE
ncbi:hypothetical protein BB560_006870 [Smittium megazygosporum]|uniref:Adenylate kinase isoenzyme 6 homolog n=1 Tax=Smittium megazygosporum TaxID=133381 RepID=A0A2T9Y0Q1_9FUNG|nr:hypothetical protein BB560_006870 [Smittium megazygosporum]